MPDIRPLFGAPNRDAAKILEDFGAIIRGVRPLNSRQQALLPLEIKKLFHRLSDERSSRRTDYLNEPAALTAYTHYYHWWNLVRLTRLFAGLGAEHLSIPENGVCVDLGSGPLTVPTALWLARPELRKRRLTWYCIDRSRTALSLGEELYLATAARTNAAGQTSLPRHTCLPWRIVRIQGEAGIAVRQKAHFVAAANVFNEILQNAARSPEVLAHNAAVLLASYTEPASDGTILLVEPGIPPSAHFVSLVREQVLDAGWHIQAPCPHEERCPMDGSQNVNGRKGGKWCHFVFPTEDAPKPLRTLSDSAGLSKDRATLSFLLANNRENREKPSPSIPLFSVRIASNPIALPGNRTGFYGCSGLGLTLLETPEGAALSRESRSLELCSGALASLPDPAKQPLMDRKSGAARVMFF
ncbi:MAG: small ribosomal subunit Rsm22 family protein [Treponema sp.]|jgi:hypothetical protein|nr:small ribosomal subunit Rsm22 family protein [Treponema sp.]